MTIHNNFYCTNLSIERANEVIDSEVEKVVNSEGSYSTDDLSNTFNDASDGSEEFYWDFQFDNLDELHCYTRFFYFKNRGIDEKDEEFSLKEEKYTCIAGGTVLNSKQLCELKDFLEEAINDHEAIQHFDINNPEIREWLRESGTGIIADELDVDFDKIDIDVIAEFGNLLTAYDSMDELISAAKYHTIIYLGQYWW